MDNKNTQDNTVIPTTGGNIFGWKFSFFGLGLIIFIGIIVAIVGPPEEYRIKVNEVPPMSTSDTIRIDSLKR